MTALAALGELRPDAYAGWEPEQLTAALKGHRIEVRQIGRRIDGKTVNRRGAARVGIHAAITKRSEAKPRE